MSGIRVNNGAKKIEVNDQGDFITLNFGDASFAKRFFEMLDRAEARTKAALPDAQALEAKISRDSKEYLQATADLWSKVHEDIRDEIDAFFGPDTCRKVFGGIVPDIALYNDFFDQLMPYFQEYANAHAERAKKYSADRQGNV